jgi:hypothetical protein
MRAERRGLPLADAHMSVAMSEADLLDLVLPVLRSPVLRSPVLRSPVLRSPVLRSPVRAMPPQRPLTKLLRPIPPYADQRISVPSPF